MNDERIHCSRCGKSVSTPVPADTIVRAWIECPECLDGLERRVRPEVHPIGCLCGDCQTARDAEARDPRDGRRHV